MRSHLVRLSLLSVFVVSAAYQMRFPSEIRLGSFLASAPFLAEFHDAEEGYRWTRARSCISFEDPGPRGAGRIELELSGFRPRGEPEPVALLEVGGETHRIATPRRFETVSIPASARGVLTTDVELCIRSETFTPGPMDQRSLGVRVARARYVPERGGVPPLGPIAFTLLFAVASFSCLRRAFGSPSRAGLVAAMGVLALGIGFLAFRPWTAFLAPLLAGLAALSWIWGRAFPASLAVAAELATASARALGAGLRAVLSRRGAGLALVSVVAAILAFVARPSFVVDLGSGLDAPLVRRFGPPDGEAGVTFRRALAGAGVDLRDFGGGTTWRITVTASSPEPGASSEIALLRVGDSELLSQLDPAWSKATLDAPVPSGWRAGPVVELPSASPGRTLRVDRFEIERGRALPSVRLLALVAGTALVLLAAVAALGLGPGKELILASSLALLESFALYLDPVGFVPLTGTLLLLALFALGGAAAGGGALRMARGRGLELDPRIPLVAIIGFLVWMTAMSYPLYSGRHFVYHSNIAEEIWKGKFLVFYLPHPDNILSREAQWGGLVVPYPCLYHTLVAPLTALPAAWFVFVHKLFQAVLLAAMALVAGVLAARFSGPSGGLAAAAVAVALVSSFQLLGLAHFLTVFGCAMSSLALGFTVLFLERLPERRIWWAVVALTSLAFLSYTASLLFTALALAAAVPFVYRSDRRLARHLASATAAAVGVAFFAYYVHWVMPFLRESIPILLASEGGAPEPFPLFARIAAIPRKLGYSFGSAIVPLTGLAGIGLAVRRGGPLGRIVLLAWIAILVVFSGFDLFFNFILKHHYFVMVPLAVGIGVLAAALAGSERRWTRLLAFALVAFCLALGARAALALATGTIQ